MSAATTIDVAAGAQESSEAAAGVFIKAVAVVGTALCASKARARGAEVSVTTFAVPIPSEIQTLCEHNRLHNA